MVKRHKHQFTRLYFHYGPYGPQDCHIHVCFDEGCSRVLVGTGRHCSGKKEDHIRQTLKVDEDIK